jgi:hypothetical protein
MTGENHAWHAANQTYLVAELALIRVALARHAAAATGQPAPDTDEAGLIAARDAARSAVTGVTSLEALSAGFALSSFETGVLLLAAGCELDAGFAAECARASGSPHPTFGLALAVFPGGHWSALSPDAPLRRWRLVELAPGQGLTSAGLRIDERILHYLAGVSHQDERLAGLASVEPPPAAPLAPTHQRLVNDAAEAWSRAASGWPLPAIQLHGEDAATLRGLAAALAAALGYTVSRMPADLLPADAGQRSALARLWEREALLNGHALLLDCDEIDPTDATRSAMVGHICEGLLPGGLLLVTGRERRRLAGRPSLTVEAPRLPTAEQRQLWQQALGPVAGELNGHLDALASQFNLGPAAIAAAAAEAGVTAATGFPALWAACCRQARPQLDDLAQRIEPAATWDDLVLPALQMDTLHEIAGQVRQRAKVYEEWGFGRRGARGLGISALFAGPSGTGKTLAAEVLAGALGLDLYRVDLSQVVSKYIGETEKNLRRVFDAADLGGVVLLFDEADALFGRRSEVKDSHDRYANIEVSYLLQRMEAYRGLAILTTNMRSALDQAFVRRLRFIVQFPFPDASQREAIWRRAFPPGVPCAGLDMARLARLSVTGGNIRNIALNAAFLAAAQDEPVGMVHLLRAAAGEFAKMEKPLTEAEVKGWV